MDRGLPIGTAAGANAFIASGATCVKAGNGMVSTWTLAGSTTTYSGSYSTDGYNITAALTWVDPGTDFTTGYGGSGDGAAGDEVGMGTCVATLQTDGATELAAATTTEGNYALCHFIFWTSATGTVNLVAAASGANDWGQSNYLNETQWGTAGNGVKGNGMKATNSGGTIISATTQGHALTPAGASGTTTITAGTKNFFWYQPVWSNTYAATALRRYNGGGTEAEKVKAYCVSQRKLDGATHISNGFVAQTAVTTLTGASALAASALALGVASLAI